MMKLPNLEKYVEEKNFMRSLFGSSDLDINRSEDRKELLDQIECDLSPENISCDGEASRARIYARKQLLESARNELTAAFQ